MTARILPWLVLLMTVLGLLGCEPSLPPLLSVDEVTPRSVERFEQLELHGSGYPTGHTASVIFRGVLRRPGALPETTVITATGKVSDPRTVRVLFDERLERRFALRGGSLAHVTFHGAVELRFQSAAGPEVHGQKLDVELDVRPTAARSTGDAAAGRDLLAALGATASDGPDVVIDQVAPGSHAASAGLLPGDHVVSFDGVRVHGLEDLAPQRAESSAELRVLRAGSQTERVLRISGPALQRGIDTRELGFVVALAVAALVLAFFVARPPRALRRAELWAGTLWSSPGASPWRRVDPRRWLHRCWLALPVLTMFAVLPSLPWLSALDLPSLFLLWLLCRTLLERPEARRFGSLRGASSWLLGHMLGLFPWAALCMLVLLRTSALGVIDVAQEQGGYPWQWLALRSPFFLAATVLALTSRPAARASRSPGSAAAVAFDIFEAAMLVTLVGGAWHLPVGAPWGEGSALEPSLLGALCFVLKVLGLYAVRGVLAARSLRHGVRPALAALGLAVAQVGLAPVVARATVETACGVALALVLTALAAWLIVRGALAPRGEHDELLG